MLVDDKDRFSKEINGLNIEDGGNQLLLCLIKKTESFSPTAKMRRKTLLNFYFFNCPSFGADSAIILASAVLGKREGRTNTVQCRRPPQMCLLSYPEAKLWASVISRETYGSSAHFFLDYLFLRSGQAFHGPSLCVEKIY